MGELLEDCDGRGGGARGAGILLGGCKLVLLLVAVEEKGRKARMTNKAAPTSFILISILRFPPSDLSHHALL